MNFRMYLSACMLFVGTGGVLPAYCAINSDATVPSIPHITQSIELDGILDETAWENALVVKLNYEVSPGENIAAPVSTKALLFENGTTLFIGFIAKDPNPQDIRSYLSERDDIWQSDYVGITLDTFNDSRKAYQFLSNPLGIQSDSLIDEITENQDFGWDSIWQSEGRVTNYGYVVEFAIPLRVMRFATDSKRNTWGIKLTRTLPREYKHELSSIKQNRNSSCRICQFGKIKGVNRTENSNSLLLIPSFTTEKSEKRTLLDSAWDDAQSNTRGSLDLRWTVNQNNFLSATINPDFSEVEADEIQVETNKRFAVFVPEKRSFFTEGSDYFSNWSRFVHTKIFLEPENGLKLTGKSGSHSYGLMSVEDKDTRFLLPGSQSSRLVTLENQNSSNQILRYRYDIGEKANIGFTYTDRDSDDYSNEMLSLDGKYWFNDSDYLKAQVMFSDTNNPLSVQQSFNRKAKESGDGFALNYTHSSRNWGWLVSHFYFGDEFRADAGYINQSNWKRSGGLLSRRWYPSMKESWWNKISLSGLWQKDSEIDGVDLGEQKSMELAIESSFQSEVGMGVYKNTDFFASEYFDSSTVEFFASWTASPGLDLDLVISKGDQIDFSSAKLGTQKTYNTSINYQINEHWKIKNEYIQESLKVVGETGFDIKLNNASVSYQHDRKNFLRLTIQAQADGEDRSLATQLLYKYKVNPFTLFHLGYSDNGFRTSEIQQLKKVERKVFMKFSYAWGL